MRSFVRRIVGVLVLTLAMQAGLGGITATAAHAVTSCYGYSCHGFDPVAKSCPVSSTTVTYGTLATVWNRYSYACKANWARAQLTLTAIAAGYQWSVQIATTDSRGYSELACQPTTDNNLGYLDERCVGPMNPTWVNYESTWYTDMVDGTNVTTAYVYVFQPTSAPWPWLAVAQYSASQ
jgi:hypothetical protein